jgi:DNA-binding transcriptional MerR regulator
MAYSISKLGQAFGLSRSTLIYYDKQGLLKPSSRTDSNYRQYTKNDYERLAKIMIYRDSGLSLTLIAELLDQKGKTHRVKMLEDQVTELNEKIHRLRKQQKVTIELLRTDGIDCPARLMSKEQWVKLLESSGMSDEDMWQWHIEFERFMPEAHQDFLESLNIPISEIRAIRKRAGKS